MGLRTVSAPAELEPIFAQAEALVSSYFARRQEDPSQGKLEISGERYVLVRAASLSVEFFGIVEELYGPGREAEADAFARNLLFDLAHALGRSDANEFHRKAKVDDPLQRLSAGPVHFAYSGWAFVEISPRSNPVPGDDFWLQYDHPYSFEAESWLNAPRRRANQLPVCIMNAGYSSGWCENSFGFSLVAAEVMCRACGDEACRFIMAPPARIEEHIARFGRDASGTSGAAGARRAEVPDFFARKRIEEELRKAQADLEQRVADRTRELTQANALLKRQMVEREKIAKQLRQAHKLEAIGRLSGGIAHDFNNLLAIFMTRGGLLERRLTQHLPAGDPALLDLSEMLKAGERAATLTAQLLAFSRGQMLDRDRLDLGAVVRDLASTLVPLIGADVELARRDEPAPLPIRADRGQIEQVIMNLVVNARDAMPEGGLLILATESRTLTAPLRTLTGELQPRTYAVLTVADTGSGMDEETQSKMFDPFFTTKPEGKGTGLGLATVYGVVQQCDGGITIESAIGVGTTFKVYLPLDAGAAHVPIPAVPTRDATRQGNETLLLVEDEKELRSAVAEILSDSGYHVIETSSPQEALKIGEDPSREIGLLLTDLVMPKLGGVELARRILAHRPAMRVLFVSGYAPEGAERETMLADDRTAFLAKPFQPSELLRRIRALLDR